MLCKDLLIYFPLIIVISGPAVWFVLEELLPSRSKKNIDFCFFYSSQTQTFFWSHQRSGYLSSNVKSWLLDLSSPAHKPDAKGYPRGPTEVCRWAHQPAGGRSEGARGPGEAGGTPQESPTGTQPRHTTHYTLQLGFLPLPLSHNACTHSSVDKTLNNTSLELLAG